MMTGNWRSDPFSAERSRRRPWAVLLALAVLGSAMGGGAARAQRGDPYQRARQQLVATAVKSAGVDDPRVLRSMLRTPRHEFVAPQLRAKAYYDMALPIGNQQTISSPFIVAYMTQSLDPKPTDKVLEIGTGSGYQAAILSPLVKEVYSIEIVPDLGHRAERTLRRLKYRNVHTRIGDGFQGWSEHAPFDKIIVTCSPEKVPVPLVEQLREGGLMVIPVGQRYQQTLYLMRKVEGKLTEEALRPTLFVPMTGRAEEVRERKPDPLNPAIANGNFEQAVTQGEFIPGWYYQRLLTWESEDAPEGKHFIRFTNDDPGRTAHLLQGFAVDGQAVPRLQLKLRVKCRNVADGPARDDFATLAISFYDESRKDLGFRLVGHFKGTHDWQLVEEVVPVPPQAREGILRIGLFGATGSLSVDDVQMSKAQEN